MLPGDNGPELRAATFIKCNCVYQGEVAYRLFGFVPLAQMYRQCCPRCGSADKIVRFWKVEVPLSRKKPE